MAELLNPGTKVKYKALFKGKETWLEGVVHGVRSYETPDGKVSKQTYLIDTGNDNTDYSHSFMADKRQLALIEKAHSLIHKNMPADLAEDHPDYLPTLHKVTDAAYATAAKSKLPKSEQVEVVNRQPEQIECQEKHVKPL